jgi:hypothetical protein
VLRSLTKQVLKASICAISLLLTGYRIMYVSHGRRFSRIVFRAT